MVVTSARSFICFWYLWNTAQLAISGHSCCCCRAAGSVAPEVGLAIKALTWRSSCSMEESLLVVDPNTVATGYRAFSSGLVCGGGSSLGVGSQTSDMDPRTMPPPTEMKNQYFGYCHSRPLPVSSCTHAGYLTYILISTYLH